MRVAPKAWAFLKIPRGVLGLTDINGTEKESENHRNTKNKKGTTPACGRRHSSLAGGPIVTLQIPPTGRRVGHGSGQGLPGTPALAYTR